MSGGWWCFYSQCILLYAALSMRDLDCCVQIVRPHAVSEWTFVNRWIPVLWFNKGQVYRKTQAISHVSRLDERELTLGALKSISSACVSLYGNMNNKLTRLWGTSQELQAYAAPNCHGEHPVLDRSSITAFWTDEGTEFIVAIALRSTRSTSRKSDRRLE